MAPVDKFTVYAVIVGVVILIALLITLYQKISGGHDKKKPRPQAARAAAPAPAQGPPGVRRRGPRRGRMLVQRDDSGGEDEGEGEEEGVFEEFAQPEGKIGAKKLRKLQEKAEKKAAREAMEQEREEKRQRDAEIEARRKKEEEKRKIEEAAKEEEERLARLEKERQEHEEYLKMKEMFSVDEEGQEDVAADLNSQSLLQEFINYIKATKVVMLEDLAAHFKLKTQDVIQRVQELQKEGQLTGVVDDRGKFIYITMEELESVAKFIRQHGRVSITELAKSSNSLVSLEPDPTLQRSYLASLRVEEEEEEA